ncbi:MAG: Uma2 family endonuclease [Polyangiaceae bacterium]|nr:Uma2 family endonuclease [Polyangiaceae bacterium]
MRRHRSSYEDYLLNEYLNGEIFGMAGGTPEHAANTLAIAAELHAQLKGKPCRAYSPDLRVRVLETGLATYPDVSVVCGPMEFDPDGRNTATNPTLLVEVLSPGTEDYDRGEKREHYFTIPSLREYLLVSQTERKMELYRRTGDAWSHEVALNGGCESGC